MSKLIDGIPSLLARTSIRTQMLVVLLLSLLPVVTLATYHIRGDMIAARENIERIALSIAQVNAAEIARSLKVTEKILDSLSKNPDIGALDPARCGHWFEHFPEFSPNHANLLTKTLDGRAICSSLPIVGGPRFEMGHFLSEVGESSHIVFGTPYQGLLSKRWVVPLDFPIRDGAGLVTGTVTAPLDLLNFNPFLGDGVFDGLPEGTTATLFASDMTMLARSRDPEKWIGSNRAKNTALAELVAARSGTTRFVSALDHIDRIHGAAAVPGSSWVTVASIPTAPLDATLNALIERWLGIGGLTLAVTLALAYALARQTAKPILAFAATVERIGRGDTKARAIPEGSSEVVSLASAFNGTLDVLAERTRLVQHHYESLLALNDIAALGHGGEGRQLARVLALGAKHLGLPLGIISRIEGDTYTVIQHVAPAGTDLTNGQTFALGQTSCAITMQTGDITAISHMGRSVHAGHPCYKAFGLEAYLGVPITVRGEPFGTLNFSSSTPYGREFDAADMEFMRLLARWVCAVMEHQLYDREILASKETAERAQRDLAQQARRLAESNAELEQFAYVASHDLREPLRMVSSYLSLLERRYEGQLDQDGREFLGFARDGVMRMDRLVLDLLDFSRIDRRGDPIIAMPVLPALQSALDHLGSAVEECGAVLAMDETIPSAWVIGDPVQIMRLFQNLIGNALKYRRPDVVPHIRIGARRGDDRWEFSIADNGIGIAPEYFDRIFGIFQRLHTRDVYEGTGIGLAICKKIVERHDGRIWLTSIPGEGTTFFFTLPAGPEMPGDEI